jgi:magnesium chelatase family protein
VQTQRYARLAPGAGVRSNAQADGTLLEAVAHPDAAGAKLLAEVTDAMRLSARGYHRVLKVARTLADMEGAETVGRIHIAEAASYRRVHFGG